MMRRLLVIATAAAALSLAACANGAGDEAGAPGPAASAAAPSLSAPSVPSEEPSVPSQEPGGAGETTTLTGTIKAGVEPNCLMLDDHLLVFGDPALKSEARAGAKVTVTGQVAEGMMTTCMQGTPFRVSTIRAN